MTDLTNIHTPVLLDDCVRLVVPALDHPGAVVVDCTLGLAGHATAFLKAAPQARLIGIDRDEEALGMATLRMKEEGLEDRFIPVHAAFDEFDDVLEELGLRRVDAAFMDLGLSSLQIDETDRGFSYSHDAPLDMRMDTSQGFDAAQILAEYPQDELVRIFREYGQERFAKPIARAIVRQREKEPLKTSRQLDELVDRIVPKSHRAKGNPAKRVFQALRIEVNGELDKLGRTLPQIANRLAPGGRLVVESYHSLEDRTVKTFMAQGLNVDAPVDLPVVPADAQPFFKELTRGALKADQAEIEHNPRSAPVRLRGVELTREIPERWRIRFAQDSKEDPVHTPDRHAAFARDLRHDRNKRSQGTRNQGNPGERRR
ncbi:16S rRNA (cytosine(1402)-N(4))-methyltransferase RsmH [Bifidobacterium sp. ESL0800]|uniref:16S rRNA (cytosine(1402)-N(4))-methyltransferase RsmH n=1 Tax=Bifidobacterium sp. ESL0800 TaxID=2983236 RepID=UPI0023F73C1B|nr:16S rRNA (cytosine(1402)-N(4))-methyltransferase RsmH [Bifidobacterium sp. ESL0800]WEV74967.1 16S rRNA (cytosine(1402)-N(4))-methyltransferase RsmH [Bifidobacterium sp. ESL0800]